MNKQELIVAISEKGDMTKRAATAFLDALAEIVTEQVKSGNEVNLTGLGKFHGAVRSARVSRNPKNGGEILIPEKMVAKFKLSATLKNAVAAGCATGEA